MKTRFFLSVVAFVAIGASAIACDLDQQLDRLRKLGATRICFEYVTEIDAHRLLPYSYWRVEFVRNGKLVWEVGATASEALAHVIEDIERDVYSSVEFGARIELQ